MHFSTVLVPTWHKITHTKPRFCHFSQLNCQKEFQGKCNCLKSETQFTHLFKTCSSKISLHSYYIILITWNELNRKYNRKHPFVQLGRKCIWKNLLICFSFNTSMHNFYANCQRMKTRVCVHPKLKHVLNIFYSFFFVFSKILIAHLKLVFKPHYICSWGLSGLCKISRDISVLKALSRERKLIYDVFSHWCRL